MVHKELVARRDDLRVRVVWKLPAAQIVRVRRHPRDVDLSTVGAGARAGIVTRVDAIYLSAAAWRSVASARALLARRRAGRPAGSRHHGRRRLHRDAIVDVAEVVEDGRRRVVVPPLAVNDKLVLMDGRRQVDGLIPLAGRADLSP